MFSRAAVIVAALLVWVVIPAAAAAAGPGRQCSGIAGIPCDEGLWCDLQPGICKGADIAGQCVRVSNSCPEIFMPVCGCNGATYGNDCERRAARVQKAHDGHCRDVERPRSGRKHRW
jgi:hypothetical protein